MQLKLAFAAMLATGFRRRRRVHDRPLGRTPLTATQTLTSIPVTGTIPGCGTFTGTANITGFAVQNGQLVANGTLTGTLLTRSATRSGR